MTRHRDRPFFAYYPMAPSTPPSSRRPTGAKEPGDRRASRGQGDPAHFADMVAYMDREVGEIVAALGRNGLLENTLILFTGDNGTPRRSPRCAGRSPSPAVRAR